MSDALTLAHREMLAEGGLTERVVKERGYRSSQSKADLAKIGFGASQQLHPALVVPVFDVWGELSHHQIRPNNPRSGKDGRVVKYESPTRSRNVLDIHPDARGLMSNPEYPLVVTEGVKKADSCLSLLSVPAIALTGVYGWRGRDVNDALVALPDWEVVPLNREVLLVFDSDIMRKEPVLAACTRLGAFLERRGADVWYVRLPDGAHGAKVGLDDFLVTGAKLADLRELALSEPPRSRVTVAAEPEEDTYDDVPDEAGAELLDDLAGFFRRFLIFASAQIPDALALWALHSYLIAVFAISPRLHVKSAEKRSGKSRVIEVVFCLCDRAEVAVLPSAAAVFRLTEATQPTWLLDEMDNMLAASEEARAAMLAIINAGYRRGATVPRVEKVREQWVVTRFHIFAAVAMAGLGDLPDTTADRSIEIDMQRKMATERTEYFHIERTFVEAGPLRRRCAAWAKRNAEVLAPAIPELPAELDDRARECWEPLLAIADQAGGAWPERGRNAARLLSGYRTSTETPGIRLLSDLRELWADAERGWGERVATGDILFALWHIEESEWATFSAGSQLTARALGILLGKFHVESDRWDRADGKGKERGYLRSDLEPVWARYPWISPMNRPKRPKRSEGASDDKPPGQDVRDSEAARTGSAASAGSIDGEEKRRDGRRRKI